MAKADTPKPDAKRAAPALHPRFFTPAESVRVIYSATIPAGVDPDDILVPGFWALLAPSLRPGDRIEATAEDGSFYSELIVQWATRTEAKVARHSLTKLDVASPGEQVLLAEYEVSHTLATRWRVVRKSDRQVLAEHLPDRVSAISWLATHNQQYAA